MDCHLISIKIGIKCSTNKRETYETYDELRRALDAGTISGDTLIRFVANEQKERIVICTPFDLLGHYFEDTNMALLAYENKVITLHQKIHVKRSGRDVDGNEIFKIIETTLGRLIFNEIIPQDLGFVDRSNPV